MAMDVREKLVEMLTEFYGSDPMYYGVDASAIAQHLIDNGVTAVVRCKDCAVPHNKYTGCPELNGLVTPPDFYCPFGERKEGANNG